MAKKDLGITINVGGNTTKLSQAMDEPNKKISEAEKNLKALEKASNLSPAGIKAFFSAQKELSNAIEGTKEKLKILKDAKTQVDEQFKNGKISSAQWAEYNNQISATESKLKSLKSQKLGLGNVINGIIPGIKSAGGALINGLAVGFTATATAATAAMGAIFKVTTNAGAAADEINTLSKTTGLSVEEIQKYKYAAETIDVPLETMTGAMSKLTKGMGTAKSGTGEYAKTLKSLGINVKDSKGELRNNNEVFKETIAALGKIKNETERDAVAMKLFGKSAQELNPLIEGGVETLDELGKRAEDAGLILSEDMLNSLNKVQDAQDEFNSATKQAGMLVGTLFAEDLAKGMSAINDFILSLTKAYSEGGFDGLMIAVQEGINSLLTFIAENGPSFLEMGMNIIVNLGQGILDNIDGLIASANTLLQGFLNTFTANLPQIITMGIQLILKLIEGLIQTIPALISAIPGIISAIVKGFSDALPQILDIGKNIVKGIWDGIVAMTSWFTEQINGFFSGIVDGAKNALGIKSPSRVFRDEIGKYMAQGVAVGFTGEYPKVINDINNTLSAGSVTISNNLTFNGNSYSARDGLSISRNINRQLGLAYRT